MAQTYLKKELMMTLRFRLSKGKEKCCFVSGIWGVAFFVLKKAWNKQNLGAQPALIGMVRLPSVAPCKGHFSGVTL